MARPQLKHTANMCTLIQAAKLLGIKHPQLRRRIRSRAFPPPTLIDDYGTRYFGPQWIVEARAALEREKDPEVWLASCEAVTPNLEA